MIVAGSYRRRLQSSFWPVRRAAYTLTSQAMTTAM
jgi:hypothetical protein